MHCALQFWGGGVLSVTSARFIGYGVGRWCNDVNNEYLAPFPVSDEDTGKCIVNELKETIYPE
jgi:hypothetical protein